MQKFDLKDICFFDCETTGVPSNSKTRELLDENEF